MYTNKFIFYYLAAFCNSGLIINAPSRKISHVVLALPLHNTDIIKLRPGNKHVILEQTTN